LKPYKAWRGHPGLEIKTTGLRRISQGDYRIIYIIDDNAQIVTVVHGRTPTRNIQDIFNEESEVKQFMESKVNYRQAALKKYGNLCVHCGFGIAEILEVAHIDGNRNNNDLTNLVVLCPTCHKMHDIDLISTEMIVAMRDNPKKADWGKRMKDAAKKAALTRKHRNAGKKAAATRKVRNSLEHASD
jgi:hypothetical protein